MLNENYIKNKRKERDEIDEKIKEFLENGGEIKVLGIEERTVFDNGKKEMIEKRIKKKEDAGAP